MAFPPLPAATSVWAIPGQLAGASGAEQEGDRNEKEKSILVFFNATLSAILSASSGRFRLFI